MLTVFICCNWSTFQSAFCQPCNFMTYSEIVPMAESSNWVDSGDLILLPGMHCQCTSVYIGFVVEYWPIVGSVATCGMGTIAILNFAICVVSLPCFSLCHHPPYLCALPNDPSPYSYTLAQYWFIPWEKLVKISHYLFCQIMYKKANR